MQADEYAADDYAVSFSVRIFASTTATGHRLLPTGVEACHIFRTVAIISSRAQRP